MAAIVASSVPLSSQFDDLVSCTNALLPGIEAGFAQFVESKILVQSKLYIKSEDLNKLKVENDRLQIKLKHARSQFDYQLQQRMEAEEGKKHYEKQFSIILELLGDNKLDTLSESDRQSLARLKEAKKYSYSSLSYVESSAVLSPSDVSVDPGEEDGDVSILRDGKKWKRRRTESIDKLISPPNKKTKATTPSSQGAAAPGPSAHSGTRSGQNSLSPVGELNLVPPLDRQFKKAPSDVKRRKPSKGHIKHMGLPPSYDDLELAIVNTPTPTPEKLPLDMSVNDPSPSAPPPSSLYPILPGNSSDAASPHQPFPDPGEAVNVINPVANCRSEFNMLRRHTFFMKTVVKLEQTLCDVCTKKIKFSKNCYKCKDCRMVCHPECRDLAPLPCIPSVPTPKRKQNNELASFCPRSIPRVPAIVVHCVNEIERRGLCTVGLYRVPGSAKTIKEVRERLLKGRGNPGLDKLPDVYVICSVLTGFLKSLREPILTFRMHPIFVKAAEYEAEEDGLASTLEALAELPPANKDTLAFLILHLQKVAQHCDANKMPVNSLAKIFGPTIVGHASSNPKDDVILQDTEKQPKVMMRLLGIAEEYWRQYMSEEVHPELAASPMFPRSPSSAYSPSPGPFRSPSTPEPRPVPESPYLGPCQSPGAMKKSILSRPGSRGVSRSKKLGSNNLLGPLE